MAVIGRILRLARHLDRELALVYSSAGLDFGLFDVLATLRRSGPPYRLSPGQLHASCMLTSGAMTARLDRLTERGHVVRTPDRCDRRALLVELTPAGFSLIDSLVVDHLQNEERILAGLSRPQRDRLGALLRDLLSDLERPSLK